MTDLIVYSVEYVSFYFDVTGHINNLNNYCIWKLVQNEGLTTGEAQKQINVSNKLIFSFKVFFNIFIVMPITIALLVRRNTLSSAFLITHISLLPLLCSFITVSHNACTYSMFHNILHPMSVTTMSVQTPFPNFEG